MAPASRFNSSANYSRQDRILRRAFKLQVPPVPLAKRPVRASPRALNSAGEISSAIRSVRPLGEVSPLYNNTGWR